MIHNQKVGIVLNKIRIISTGDLLLLLLLLLLHLKHINQPIRYQFLNTRPMSDTRCYACDQCYQHNDLLSSELFIISVFDGTYCH